MFQKEIVIITADQKEICEESALSLESTSSNDEALSFSDVLLDLHCTEEPEAVAEELLTVTKVSQIVSVLGSQLEIHIENLKSEREEVDAQFPVLFKFEEPTTTDAEQPFTEDEELLKMVEMIISDEEEHVSNGSESVLMEQKCEGTLDGFVKAMVEDEEPIDGTEEPLIVAEEIEAIVQEILQISEDQALSIAHKQNGREAMIHVNESGESEVSEEAAQKNYFMDTSDALEAPERLSESAVIIEEEMARVTVESIFLCNGTAAREEESWVIIEEPAAAYTYSRHPGAVKEESPTSPSNAEEERDDLATSTKLLAHLRAACVEAFEGSSYKPVRVDVRGNQSTIHVTIEVRPLDKDEFGNNTFVRAEENNFTQRISKNDVHCSTVSHISWIDACM